MCSVQETSTRLVRFQFLASISRTKQMYVLLGLAFLPQLAYSLMIFAGLWHPSPATHARLLRAILVEISFLLALYLVLASQNRNFASIGFSPVPPRSDIGRSLLLFLWSLLCTLVARWIILRRGGFPFS
jgi:hypothetical protein